MDYCRLNLLPKENTGVKFPNIDLGKDIFHYNPKIISDKAICTYRDDIKLKTCICVLCAIEEAINTQRKNM